MTPVPQTAMDNAALTALLVAAGQGDAKAFRDLAKALGPRMYGLAARLMDGSGTQGQDVVQEVLIKLWQFAPRWQVGGSVSAYASQLIYTTAMDQHRKKMPTTDEIPEVGEDETMTARIYHKEQNGLLMNALRQLPERQQEAVRLAYFHEYKAQDVASAMGTTEKAVESLLVRAKRTLADLLPKDLKQGEAA